MNIKQPRQHDLPQIMSLINENKAFIPGYEKDSFEKNMSMYIEQGLALCAYDQQELIAVLTYHLKRKELDLLCVKQSVRRQGVATRLLQEVSTIFSQNDVIHMKTPQVNIDLVFFLSSMGFQEKGIEMCLGKEWVCFETKIK